MVVSSYFRTPESLVIRFLMLLSCSQMYQVFTNRWTGYHTPIMTVVFKPHPEFCRRDTDKGVDSDFNKVITDLSKAPGAPSPTLMKLQYEEFWITCKTGFMGHCDDG